MITTASSEGRVGWGQARCSGRFTAYFDILRLTTRGLARSGRLGRMPKAISSAAGGQDGGEEAVLVLGLWAAGVVDGVDDHPDRDALAPAIAVGVLVDPGQIRAILEDLLHRQVLVGLGPPQQLRACLGSLGPQF